MLHEPGDPRAGSLPPDLALAVVAGMPDGLAVHDRAGALVAWSPGAQSITGWTIDEASERFPRDLPAGLAEVGSGCWIDVRPLEIDAGGGWGSSVTLFSDARARLALREAFGQLHEAATMDPLTGLPNRLLAEDRLRLSVELAHRDARIVGVLHLDLDRFKLINDTLGNAAGDLLLQAVARRVRGAIGEADTVARIGDDEFIVLLHDLGDATAAEQVAAAVLASLAEPFRLNGQAVYVGSSIGIALFPEHGPDPRTLLSHAHLAMHRAKRNGGNGVCVDAPTMSERSRQRLSVAVDLHHAMARGQLVVHYQPQIDANTGTVVGAEALVRWQHPTRGLILPDDFLDIAEENGSIVDIDDWVLRTACAQVARWDGMGVHVPAIGVNLAARTMLHGDVVPMVRAVLDASGLPAHRLEVEVSEHLVAGETSDVEKTLSALKDLGIQLAIDDFGTGYSSLGHLKRFPIDAIKLDRSFVVDVTAQPDPADVAVLRAVVRMAADLHLRCIAEGVETPAQRTVLRYLRCHLVQGYLYSSPVSGEEFPRRMQRMGLHVRPPVVLAGG